MTSSLTLFHVRGIEIRVNISVLVIVSLVTWSLAEGVLPEFAEGYTTGEYWSTAAILAVALLAALVAHELGHALVAGAEGVTVSRITLWLFGGVAELDSAPTTPRSAFRIAAAGPLVSIVLGVAAVAVSLGFDGLIGVAIAYYGAINLLLAGFNLVPAFPMDGGRIYQAWRWARTGDAALATKKAAELGHGIGGFMIALGIFEVFIGAAIGGIWMILLGWFVREAARAELQRVVLEQPLATVAVSEIMTPFPECVRHDVDLERFVAEMVVGGLYSSYPVVADDGSLAGLITLDAVRAEDRARWATTTVGAAATPAADVATVESDASVADVLTVTKGDPRARTIVVADGRPIGIVAPADIARLVTAVELAGPEAFAAR